MENRFIQDLGIFAFEYDGYYSIVRFDKKIRLYTIEFNVSDEEDGAFLEYLDGLRDEFPTLGSQRKFRHHKLIIPINIKEMDINVDLARIVQLISEELSIRNYTQRCNQTGRTHDLGVYRIGNQVEILNKEVYFDIIDNNVKDFEKSGSVAKGYIGAFLGMALGIVLWIVVSQLRIIAGIVGYAIAYFGIQGFERANRKPNRNQIISIALMSILAIVLAEYLSQAIYFYRALPKVASFMTFTVEVFPAIITEYGLARNMSINALIGIVLSVLYMVPSLKAMIRDNSKDRIAYPVIDASENNK